MSKTWNIVHALKEKGPMTKTELWSHFKSSDSNFIMIMEDMKHTLHNLKKCERVKTSLIMDKNKNMNYFNFYLTDHKSNFISKEKSLENLKVLAKPGDELHEFFQKITDAENKIMTMYRATRPVEQALFEVHEKKEVVNKEYKRLRVEKETMIREAARKRAEDLRQREYDMQQLRLKQQLQLKSKDLKLGLLQQKITKEDKRISMARKLIFNRQKRAIKKGNKRLHRRAEIKKKIDASGPPGSAERRAFIQKIRADRIKQLQAHARARKRAEERKVEVAEAKKKARIEKRSKEQRQRQEDLSDIQYGAPAKAFQVAPKSQQSVGKQAQQNQDGAPKKMNQKELAKLKKQEKLNAKKQKNKK